MPNINDITEQDNYDANDEAEQPDVEQVVPTDDSSSVANNFGLADKVKRSRQIVDQNFYNYLNMLHSSPIIVVANTRAWYTNAWADILIAEAARVAPEVVGNYLEGIYKLLYINDNTMNNKQMFDKMIASMRTTAEGIETLVRKCEPIIKTHGEIIKNLVNGDKSLVPIIEREFDDNPEVRNYILGTHDEQKSTDKEEAYRFLRNVKGVDDTGGDEVWEQFKSTLLQQAPGDIDYVINELAYFSDRPDFKEFVIDIINKRPELASASMYILDDGDDKTWDLIGDLIKSSPAVASTIANNLDVFARHFLDHNKFIEMLIPLVMRQADKIIFDDNEVLDSIFANVCANRANVNDKNVLELFNRILLLNQSAGLSLVKYFSEQPDVWNILKDTFSSIKDDAQIIKALPYFIDIAVNNDDEFLNSVLGNSDNKEAVASVINALPDDKAIKIITAIMTVNPHMIADNLSYYMEELGDSEQSRELIKNIATNNSGYMAKNIKTYFNDFMLDTYGKEFCYDIFKIALYRNGKKIISGQNSFDAMDVRTLFAGMDDLDKVVKFVEDGILLYHHHDMTAQAAIANGMLSGHVEDKNKIKLNETFNPLCSVFKSAKPSFVISTKKTEKDLMNFVDAKVHKYGFVEILGKLKSDMEKVVDIIKDENDYNEAMNRIKKEYPQMAAWTDRNSGVDKEDSISKLTANADTFWANRKRLLELWKAGSNIDMDEFNNIYSHIDDELNNVVKQMRIWANKTVNVSKESIIAEFVNIGQGLDDSTKESIVNSFNMLPDNSSSQKSFKKLVNNMLGNILANNKAAIPEIIDLVSARTRPTVTKGQLIKYWEDSDNMLRLPPVAYKEIRDIIYRLSDDEIIDYNTMQNKILKPINDDMLHKHGLDVKINVKFDRYAYDNNETYITHFMLDKDSEESLLNNLHTRSNAYKKVFFFTKSMVDNGSSYQKADDLIRDIDIYKDELTEVMGFISNTDESYFESYDVLEEHIDDSFHVSPYTYRIIYEAIASSDYLATPNRELVIKELRDTYLALESPYLLDSIEDSFGKRRNLSMPDLLELLNSNANKMAENVSFEKATLSEAFKTGMHFKNINSLVWLRMIHDRDSDDLSISEVQSDTSSESGVGIQPMLRSYYKTQATLKQLSDIKWGLDNISEEEYDKANSLNDLTAFLDNVKKNNLLLTDWIESLPKYNDVVDLRRSAPEDMRNSRALHVDKIDNALDKYKANIDMGRIIETVENWEFEKVKKLLVKNGSYHEYVGERLREIMFKYGYNKNLELDEIKVHLEQRCNPEMNNKSQSRIDEVMADIEKDVSKSMKRSILAQLISPKLYDIAIKTAKYWAEKSDHTYESGDPLYMVTYDSYAGKFRSSGSRKWKGIYNKQARLYGKQVIDDDRLTKALDNLYNDIVSNFVYIHMHSNRYKAVMFDNVVKMIDINKIGKNAYKIIMDSLNGKYIAKVYDGGNYKDVERKGISDGSVITYRSSDSLYAGSYKLKRDYLSYGGNQYVTIDDIERIIYSPLHEVLIPNKDLNDKINQGHDIPRQTVIASVVGDTKQ